MKAILLVGSLFLAFSQGTQPAPPPKPAENYSGTYSFLQDGEFVQVTVEDEGKVTGFVSRYGDTDSDRGLFLDHFFKDKESKLEDKNLTFATQTVHGVAYQFKGAIERGDGKTPTDEAYYVLKGTLIQTTTLAKDKTTAQSREVVFKSFPQDAEDTPEKKK